MSKVNGDAKKHYYFYWKGTVALKLFDIRLHGTTVSKLKNIPNRIICYRFISNFSSNKKCTSSEDETEVYDIVPFFN